MKSTVNDLDNTAAQNYYAKKLFNTFTQGNTSTKYQ